MGKKKLIYSFYIVCEGAKTEPLYFKGLRDHIIKNKVWGDDTKITINISPEPEVEEEEDKKKSKHKTKRKSRKLNQPIRPNEEFIENEYKAVPTRFVREAQFQLMEEVHDEVWAVFDHDNHPAHKAAFNLAQQVINKKNVDIAFSSIAFEHWVLLHFEKNNSSFNKSECREGEQVLHCASGEYSNDCYGNSCIGGYLRIMGYIPIDETTKKEPIFPQLEAYTKLACINAAWLRHKQSTSTAIYNLNPYTNIDKLVLRLLDTPYSFKWLRLHELYEISPKSTISFIYDSDNNLKCKVETENSIIFPIGAFLVHNTKHEKVAESKNRIMVQGKQKLTLKFINIQKYYSSQSNTYFLSLNIVTCKQQLFIEL